MITREANLKIFRFLPFVRPANNYQRLQETTVAGKKTGSLGRRIANIITFGLITKLINLIRSRKTSQIDDLSLFLRKLNKVSEGEKKPSISNSDKPYKIAMPFTHTMFDLSTGWRCFPCPKAAELSVLLQSTNPAMSQKGGLELIIHSVNLLKKANEEFLGAVQLMEEQYIRVLGVGKYGKATKKENNDKNVQELKTSRLEVVDILERNFEAVLKAIGPQNQLDKLETLRSKYGGGEISKMAYKEKGGELIQKLNKMAKDIILLKNSHYPEVKKIANQWLEDINHGIERANNPFDFL